MCDINVSGEGFLLNNPSPLLLSFLLCELIKNPKGRMFEATLTSRDSHIMCMKKISVTFKHFKSVFSLGSLEFILFFFSARKVGLLLFWFSQ